MNGTRSSPALAAAAALLRVAGGIVPAIRALLAVHDRGQGNGRAAPAAQPVSGSPERPPSEKQIAFLSRLGHPNPRAIRSGREAHDEIQRLLAEEGSRA